jgi:hypothetical protein
MCRVYNMTCLSGISSCASVLPKWLAGAQPARDLYTSGDLLWPCVWDARSMLTATSMTWPLLTLRVCTRSRPAAAVNSLFQQGTPSSNRAQPNQLPPRLLHGLGYWLTHQQQHAVLTVPQGAQTPGHQASSWLCAPAAGRTAAATSWPGHPCVGAWLHQLVALNTDPTQAHNLSHKHQKRILRAWASRFTTLASTRSNQQHLQARQPGKHTLHHWHSNLTQQQDTSEQPKLTTVSLGSGLVSVRQQHLSG